MSRECSTVNINNMIQKLFGEFRSKFVLKRVSTNSGLWELSAQKVIT